jgi:nucleotide-binding universal stress UspA family protein
MSYENLVSMMRELSMGWKDILVFADGSDNGLARAQMAAELAVTMTASLEICVPVCLPSLVASAGAPTAVEIFDEIERIARDDAGRAAIEIRARLPQLADHLEVHTPEVRMGDVPRLAGALGQTCDVVAVGQPIGEDASRVDDALLEGVIFRSGRPCLMLPRWNEPQAWGKRILIAWKDVREASRAVHDALPLLQRADAVCAFFASQGAEPDGGARQTLSRLARHLGRYGVRVEDPVTQDAAAAGPAILKQAETWGADLIVMGGYGHSAFRERMLGGVTRTAIRSSRMPVLLSH